MPAKPSKKKTTRGSLSSIKGGKADKQDPTVPPWERASIGYAVGRDERFDQDVRARITGEMGRMISKLVQSRAVPQIETTSDVVRIGVGWVMWWASRSNLKGIPKGLADEVDFHMWEMDRRYSRGQRDRLTRLIDDIEEELRLALAENRLSDLATLVEELGRYRNQISHSALKSRASGLWVKYRRAVRDS